MSVDYNCMNGPVPTEGGVLSLTCRSELNFLWYAQLLFGGSYDVKFQRFILRDDTVTTVRVEARMASIPPLDRTKYIFVLSYSVFTDPARLPSIELKVVDEEFPNHAPI